MIVTVNGRYSTQRMTGVQRYAAEIVSSRVCPAGFPSFHRSATWVAFAGIPGSSFTFRATRRGLCSGRLATQDRSITGGRL